MNYNSGELSKTGRVIGLIFRKGRNNSFLINNQILKNFFLYINNIELYIV